MEDLDYNDIVDPKIIKLYGNNYRTINSEDVSNPNQPSINENEEFISDSNEIQIVNQEDHFELTLDNIPPIFYSSIIGKKGQTIKRLCYDYDVKIFIPAIDSQDPITITSSNKEAIIKAFRQIKVMNSEKLARIPPDHFISIPMLNDSIFDRFKNFKNLVLAENCSTNKEISEDMFVSEKKLHVTVVMLKLLTQKNIDLCKDILSKIFKESSKSILDDQPFEVTIEGIDVMEADKTKARVLYAKVSDHSNKLQTFSDSINQKWCESSFMNIHDKQPEIKIHMTLFKTKVVIQQNQSKIQSKTRKSFNATDILKNYSNYHFGKVIVNNVQLSSRLEIDHQNGYYKSLLIYNVN